MDEQDEQDKTEKRENKNIRNYETREKYEKGDILNHLQKQLISLQGVSPNDKENPAGSRRYDTRRLASIPFVYFVLFVADLAVIFFELRLKTASQNAARFRHCSMTRINSRDSWVLIWGSPFRVNVS